MVTIDINCDMGEGMGQDEAIMPYITSANIACGYHAGDEHTIRQTIELAMAHQVAIGAHISFSDTANFGRREMQLPPAAITGLVTQQLVIISHIADAAGVQLRHVKPHGALYNLSAKEIEVANAIAKAVKAFDKNLVLFGLSGSFSIREAKATGLQTASEVFADRSYQDDGSLTPRSEPNALITDVNASMQQVLQMIREGTVTSVTGKQVPIIADTICIHGDGPHAAAFAKTIYQTLQQQSIALKAF